MNDANKELREVLIYVDQARTMFHALNSIQRALEGGEAVEVTLRSTRHTVTTLCPNKASEKLLSKLIDQASARLTKLEEQEVFWCQEVTAANRAEQLKNYLRENPLESHASIEAQKRENTRNQWAANDDYMARHHGGVKAGQGVDTTRLSNTPAQTGAAL